ncbi:hypothetical protein NSU_3589 [Novosphingobium pentaromativorans US6-1]|uniref:Uncharacterized protein n=1 Tax=Novosphingobium pentaromativorans US6-1 TaxID=1088721 RepID=G6EGW7_9SPHN|nr:hypothetical protein NSU_3589 [Novosphingobium pentaromativorans US6-1]
MFASDRKPLAHDKSIAFCAPGSPADACFDGSLAQVSPDRLADLLL